MDTVFVYDDGTVGLRQLPSAFAHNPTYYEPVYQPVSALYEPDGQDNSPTFKKRCFSRRGRMYDGRPVFSDDARWAEVREVEMAGLFTPRDTEEQSLLHVRHNLRNFLKPYCGVVLDEHVEWSEYEARQVRQLRITQIVALPKEYDPRMPCLT